MEPYQILSLVSASGGFKRKAVFSLADRGYRDELRGIIFIWPVIKVINLRLT